MTATKFLPLPLVLILSTAAPAQTTFFVSPGVDPDGDLAWQGAAENGFLELDFEQYVQGDFVPSIGIGVATATVQLLEPDGSVSNTNASVFESSEFDYSGVMEHDTLLNGTSVAGGHQNFVRPRLRMAFSSPIPGFGTWIFDDDPNPDKVFVLTVELADGSTATSPTLDAGTTYLPEGFLGVMSDVGITAVTISGLDQSGMLIDSFFELDHVQFAWPRIGTNYCGPANDNSSGAPGVIGANGSEVVGDNALALVASNLPTSQFGYFLASETQGFVQNPGGSQGNLCLGGTIGRFVEQIQNSGQSGSFQIHVDLTDMPPPAQQVVLPGETWNFQAWFRDKNPDQTSNFSDAVSITFS